MIPTKENPAGQGRGAIAYVNQSEYYYSQFRDAIQAAGLTPPDVIEADGKLRRFAPSGRHNDDAGWYVLHADGIPAGSFGDWRTGFTQTWRADIGRALTSTEEAEHRTRIEAQRREREAVEARRHAEVAIKAAAIWEAAIPALEGHPYLARKGIGAHGAKLHDDRLVIPVRVAGEIASLQIIDGEGGKRFLPGGRMAGGYFAIGTLDEIKARGKVIVCEGYATAATIYEAIGIPSVAAFSAGNLDAVTQYLKGKFPDARIIVAGDFDRSGTGQRAATEAARAVGGIVALPVFTPEELAGEQPPSDWNDLARLHGLPAVREAIENALQGPPATAPSLTHAPAAKAQPAGDSDGWPEPLPLAAKIEAEPYPLDALPDTIRAAVEEVGGFVKAPAPLVAASALAALSLACQAHIDVQRAEKLRGPVGLFLLTIADSGERKSTCDEFFNKQILDYEEAQAEAMAPAIKEHAAKFAAWEAEREGILSAIRDTSKRAKPTDKLRRDLAEHEHMKPQAPRVPRLLLGDETPESLAWSFAKVWPSAAVMASEAGTILGSHGMSKDSAMRNMSLLNVLWDGGTHSVGRRTSESFTVKGARLTMGLMAQEITLRDFLVKAGPLARGSGFLARFLVAWPESTQGSRTFSDPPANWPHLDVFHRRIAAILDQPVPIDDNGALTPAMMALTPEAKRAWVAYHDAIESELASGGELFDVRDVASKSADNAARLAALFQMFEGAGGAIGADAFEGASRITAWHLHEARRFFGEFALPAELADAARLDSWLIEHCRQERTHMAGKNHVRQHGPLRDGARLDAAIRELAELDRLQLVKDGKRLTIQVNPALAIKGGAS